MKYDIRILMSLFCVFLYGSEIVGIGSNINKSGGNSLRNNQGNRLSYGKRKTLKKRKDKEVLEKATRLFCELEDYKKSEPSFFPPVTNFYFENIKKKILKIENISSIKKQKNLNWIVGSLGFLVRKMQNPKITFVDKENKRFRELGCNTTDCAIEETLRWGNLTPQRELLMAASLGDLELMTNEFEQFKNVILNIDSLDMNDEFEEAGINLEGFDSVKCDFSAERAMEVLGLFGYQN